jgi:hypothetical protein
VTVDVRDATAPTLASEYFRPGGGDAEVSAVEVAAHGRALYLLEGDVYGASGGLRIFDLTDPARPAFVRFVDLPSARGLDVADGRLYVSDFQGIRIFDLATPDQPRELGALRGLGFIWGPLAAAGGLVYLPYSLDVTRGPHRVAVIDARDPAVPRRVGDHLAGFFHARIDAAGPFAYLLPENGVRAFRLTECVATVGSYEPHAGTFGARSRDVAADPTHAYVAGEAGGLHVVRAPGMEEMGTCYRIRLPFTSGQL